MLQRKARLIIQEIEQGGGIDMEYVRQAAQEDGITERQMIAFWLRDHWPVSAYQSLNMADYFLDKERKGE
jgi:hypothetical protein